MRHSFAVLFFAASVLAVPQNTGLEGLSQCASTAAISAIGSTGCSLADVKCICSSPGFQAAANAAVLAKCGMADAEASKEWGATYCAAQGVPIPSSTPTISGEIGDPTLAPNSTTTEAPEETTTTWTNATCHKYPHCYDSPNNDTAPMPSPTQPEETCNGGCSGMASPTSTGTGPKYTGAAAKLGASAALGAAVLAAVLAL